MLLFKIAKMKSLAERLNYAMKLRQVRYKKEIAQMAGVSPGAVTQWLTGDTTSLAADPLIKLAKALRVRVEWLKDGTGPVEEEDAEPADDLHDYAMVQRLDVKASQGPGNLVFHASEKSRLAFRKDFLKSEGVKERNALLVYGDGHSMEPTIPDGAILMVDRGCQEFINNKIFLIWLGDEALVKRLRKEIGGGIWVVSDNPDKINYPDLLITPDKEDFLKIEGRVFWMGSRL